MTALEIAFWACAGLLVYAQARLRPAARRDRAAAPRLERRRPSPASHPDVSLIVAAYAEEARDRRQGRQRCSRSTTRATALEVIVACDGSPDAHAERGARRPAPTSCSSCRAAARSARRTRRRARRAATIVAFSDANALWEPDALRALVAPFADPRVGYVCGQVRFVNDGGARTRRALYWRYEMCAARARVAAGLGHRRQRRDLRDAARGLPRGRPDHGPRPLASRSTWSSAAGAPSTRRRRARPRRWCPTIEGEFARKRRMMSHAWPIVLRGGLLSPRGYGAALRADDRLAPRAALRHAVPARRRARAERSRCWATGALYVVTLAAQLALLVAALLARAVPRPSAAHRALLRADARPRSRSGCGTGCATARPRAGTPPEGTR